MVARDKKDSKAEGDKKKGGEKKAPELNTMILSLQVKGVRADVGQLQPPFAVTSSVSIIDPFGLTATGTIEPKLTQNGQKLGMVLDAYLQSINARISYQDIKMMLLMAKSFTSVLAQHESLYNRPKKAEVIEEDANVLLSPYLIVDKQRQDVEIHKKMEAHQLEQPVLELNLSVW